MHTKSYPTDNVDWSLWFAILSPILGVLLGVLGVFVLALKGAIMNTTKMNQKKSRRWFRARRRRHDPMLVLNMSVFNSGSSWNRIFNPIPQRENVWC